MFRAPGVALILCIHFGDAIQQIEPPGLAGDICVVIAFGKNRSRMVFAVLGRDLLELLEEMFQLSTL